MLIKEPLSLARLLASDSTHAPSVSVAPGLAGPWTLGAPEGPARNPLLRAEVAWPWPLAGDAYASAAAPAMGRERYSGGGPVRGRGEILPTSASAAPPSQAPDLRRREGPLSSRPGA
jgi:hypothetical protein